MLSRTVESFMRVSTFADDRSIIAKSHPWALRNLPFGPFWAASASSPTRAHSSRLFLDILTPMTKTWVVAPGRVDRARDVARIAGLRAELDD